jgi:hypothetical protein
MTTETMNLALNAMFVTFVGTLTTGFVAVCCIVLYGAMRAALRDD